VKWTTGVNFINILLEAFTCADLKSTKKTVKFSVFWCFWDLQAQEMLKECWWNLRQASISPTFYKQLFWTKVFRLDHKLWSTICKFLAKKCQISVCKMLIKLTTALHLTCAEGHLEAVQFLLEICKVHPEPKDRWVFGYWLTFSCDKETESDLFCLCISWHWNKWCKI